MEKLETITAKELKKILDKKEPVYLVNVLNKQNFSEAHIPGSINIPFNSPYFEENMDIKLPDLSSKIIVHCWGPECLTSRKAGKKLLEMNYDNIYEYKGGVINWHKEGYELEGTDTEQLKTEECKL